MQWLVLIGICLMGGWWLFTLLLGGEEASNAAGWHC